MIPALLGAYVVVPLLAVIVKTVSGHRERERELQRVLAEEEQRRRRGGQDRRGPDGGLPFVGADRRQADRRELTTEPSRRVASGG